MSSSSPENQVEAALAIVNYPRLKLVNGKQAVYTELADEIEYITAAQLIATSFKTSIDLSTQLSADYNEALRALATANSKLNTENLVARSLEMFMSELKDNATGDDGMMNHKLALQGRLLEKYRRFLWMGHSWVEALLLNPDLPINEVTYAKRVSHDILAATHGLLPATAVALMEMKKVLAIINGKYDFVLRALGETVQNDPPGT